MQGLLCAQTALETHRESTLRASELFEHTMLAKPAALLLLRLQ